MDTKINMDGKQRNEDYDEELQDLLMSEKESSRFRVARVSISELTPIRDRETRDVSRLTPTMEYNTCLLYTSTSVNIYFDLLLLLFSIRSDSTLYQIIVSTV